MRDKNVDGDPAVTDDRIEVLRVAVGVVSTGEDGFLAPYAC